MKYDLDQEDIDLILKALDGLTTGGILFYNRDAKDLAIEQRINQIKVKLKNED